MTVNKAEARVLPGAETYAGGKGPEFRYRQPQNLSYHPARVTTLHSGAVRLRKPVTRRF